MFALLGEGMTTTMFEPKKIKPNGTYEDTLDLKNKLADGENYIYIYFEENDSNNYGSAYSAISLNNENGEVYFSMPEVFPNNYLVTMKHAVIDPKNYLTIEMDNESEKREMIDLANKITKDAASDYDKLLKVNEWMAQNIYYDWDAYRLGTYGGKGAYEAMKDKKAVCQGYAELTQVLLKAVGIPTRLMSGYALGDGAEGKSWKDVDYSESNHAWNEAFVDNRWVTLDTTWGSSNKYEGGKFTKGEINSNYFDPSLEKFSETHKIMRAN